MNNGNLSLPVIKIGMSRVCNFYLFLWPECIRSLIDKLYQIARVLRSAVNILFMRHNRLSAITVQNMYNNIIHFYNHSGNGGKPRFILTSIINEHHYGSFRSISVIITDARYSIVPLDMMFKVFLIFKKYKNEL